MFQERVSSSIGTIIKVAGVYPHMSTTNALKATKLLSPILTGS